MNKRIDIGVVFSDLSKSCKDFAMYYNKWREKILEILNYVNPTYINEKYKTLLSVATEEKAPRSLQEFQADYNKYVDDLLKLTPHKRSTPTSITEIHKAISLEELNEKESNIKKLMSPELTMNHLTTNTMLNTSSVNDLKPDLISSFNFSQEKNVELSLDKQLCNPFQYL